MADPRDLIRERLPIEQLVGETVALKRSGGGFLGLCPFHLEKTPSFRVSPERSSYHCFSCGVSGDIFTFVQERLHIDFPEALALLGRRTGVAIPEPRQATDQRATEERLFEVTAKACLYFQRVLASPQGQPARAYLARRGITDAQIERFGLGAALPTWDGAVTYLRREGVALQDIIDAGVAVRHAQKQTVYDRFRQRVILPIRDVRGRVQGFAGRALGETEPKYMNSPSTPIFAKGRSLFGLDVAQAAIREQGEAVLVEGYLDCIRAHVEGFGNVVAAQGTAITADQVIELARSTSRLVLALDADPAGQQAATRAGLLALAAVQGKRGQGMEIRIASLPTGLDPDDLIGRNPDDWRTLIETAPFIMEHFFRLTIASLDATAFDYKQKLVDALLPAIRTLPGVGIQQTYLERLAHLTSIPVRSLDALMRGAPATPSTPARPPRPADVGSAAQAKAHAEAMARIKNLPDPLVQAESWLLALLAVHDPLPDAVVDLLIDLRMSTSARHALLNRLIGGGGLGDGAGHDGLSEAVRLVQDSSRLIPRVAPEKLVDTVTVYMTRCQELRAQAGLVGAARVVTTAHLVEDPTLAAQLTERLAERHQANIARHAADAAHHRAAKPVEVQEYDI